MKGRELATCLLFITHLDADGCLCILLNKAGEVDAPLQKRAASEIQALQIQARTILVVPTSMAGIHQLELPWLGNNKAREAIPYALEEQVAQPVSELHFAFDKAHYEKGRYLIVVIDKQLLTNWMGLLDELGIDFDHVTVDWFALHPGEILVSEHRVLIFQKQFKGALSPHLAQLYLNQTTEPCHGFLFDDSSPDVRSPQLTSMEGKFDAFIANRLHNAHSINICQGEFRHDTHRESSRRWYFVSAALFGLWLLCILGMNALSVYRLNTEQRIVNEQIAEIYHAFFPKAALVVSPKFRIEQVLKNDTSEQQGNFWYLLGQLASSIDVESKHVTIDSLHYQNQMLNGNLLCSDFASLEAFEHRLENAKLKVNQTQASSQDNHVVAILELRV
jgi:general secretion pathway protein L